MSDPITPAAAPAPPVAAPVAEAQPATPAAAPPVAAPAFANPYASRAAPPAPVAEVAPAAPPKPPAPTVTELHQTVAARDAALAKLTTEAAALHTTVASHAATQLAALPANVRAVVERRANGDPVAALSIIDTMREAGVLGAPAVAPLPVGANTAPAPSAATAPSVGAPAPTPQSNDALLLSQYQTLQSNAPQSAQMFRLRHGPAIERALASTVRN